MAVPYGCLCSDNRCVFSLLAGKLSTKRGSAVLQSVKPSERTAFAKLRTVDDIEL
jgi:hypothetical protein